jgi:hypothetical protein
MFRLVVIHQLVLSLLVGPMLCCCTTARLVGDPAIARTAGVGQKPQRKHCCGERQKSPDDGRQAPGGEKHNDPSKCPCKDAAPTVAAVPEAAGGSADLLTLLSAAVASFDLPTTTTGPTGVPRPAARFDLRSSSVSTTDLLFAHHNLRC